MGSRIVAIGELAGRFNKGLGNVHIGYRAGYQFLVVTTLLWVCMLVKAEHHLVRMVQAHIML